MGGAAVLRVGRRPLLRWPAIGQARQT